MIHQCGTFTFNSLLESMSKFSKALSLINKSKTKLKTIIITHQATEKTTDKSHTMTSKLKPLKAILGKKSLASIAFTYDKILKFTIFDRITRNRKIFSYLFQLGSFKYTQNLPFAFNIRSRFRFFDILIFDIISRNISSDKVSRKKKLLNRQMKISK